MTPLELEEMHRITDALESIARSLESVASCVRTSAAYEGREDIYYLRTEP